MTPITADVQTESSLEKTVNEGRQCCPLCNGPLILLLRCYRCSQCSFAFCVGCEAPPEAGGVCNARRLGMKHRDQLAHFVGAKSADQFLDGLNVFHLKSAGRRPGAAAVGMGASRFG